MIIYFKKQHGGIPSKTSNVAERTAFICKLKKNEKKNYFGGLEENKNKFQKEKQQNTIY